MLHPADRKAITLQHEAGALRVVSCNADDGPEIVRCIIDGAMNGLVRIEGAKAASIYAFALADRVVSGVRAPTPETASEPVELPKLRLAPPVPDEPRWLYAVLGALVSWICMGMWR